MSNFIQRLFGKKKTEKRNQRGSVSSYFTNSSPASDYPVYNQWGFPSDSSSSESDNHTSFGGGDFGGGGASGSWDSGSSSSYDSGSSDSSSCDSGSSD